MNQVFDNNDVGTGNGRVTSKQISQLDRLENDLSAKRQGRIDALAQTGIVDDISVSRDTEIQTIDQALQKISVAREQIDPRAVNYAARNGHIDVVNNGDIADDSITVESLSNIEAAHVMAIRSAASGAGIQRGEQFGTYDEYKTYVKDKKADLFAILDTKNTVV